MKILGLDVPPELAELWDRLFVLKDGTPLKGVLRSTKKSTRSSSRRKGKIKKVSVFRPIVEAILVSYGRTPTDSDFQSTVSKLIHEIHRGNFSAEYFTEISIARSQTLISTIQSEPLLPVPEWAFRDPSNLPTFPQYSVGDIDIGSPRFIGRTSNGYFEDISYKWQRLTFNLSPVSKSNPLTHPIVAISAESTVDTDTRGSRSFWDYQVLAYLHGSFSPLEFNDTPPVAWQFRAVPGAVKKIWRIRWRWRSPESGVPYYHAQTTWHAVMRALKIAGKDAVPNATRLTLSVAPTPALGLYYNNNTSVEIKSVYSVRAFQPQVLVKALLSRKRIDPRYDPGGSWDGAAGGMSSKCPYSTYFTGHGSGVLSIGVQYSFISAGFELTGLFFSAKKQEFGGSPLEFKHHDLENLYFDLASKRWGYLVYDYESQPGNPYAPFMLTKTTYSYSLRTKRSTVVDVFKVVSYVNQQDWDATEIFRITGVAP